MASDYLCFYCLARSAESLLEKISMPAEKKKNITLDLIDLYLEWQKKELAPDFSRDMYRILKGYSGIDDPYKTEKHISNLQALELIPKLEKITRQSADPFVTAIGLAIAGNVIDFAVRGMYEIARVISNEYDAPSTLPEKSGRELREHFRKADLIISKGQGNLEGLYKSDDKRIFFILLVKCTVIAELLRVEKNSLVTFNSSYLK